MGKNGEKGSKQLYNKLLLIYTAVLVSVLLVLTLYFWNSTKNRYLEQNQEYTRLMYEESAEYMNGCSEVADYLHEELYKSSMEMNDLLHYLTDSTEEYQEYRLDTYASYELPGYSGIEDFVGTAFEAYPELARIAFVSYSKSDLTAFNGGQNIYHSEDGSAVLERIESGDLAEEGEFSFTKELRDSLTMQSVGAMIMTFRADGFQRICGEYSLPQLVVFNEFGTVVYDSDPESGAGERIREGKRDGGTPSGIYLMSGSVEGYSVAGYLKKSEAGGIPFHAGVMIVGVALGVFVIAELLVRFYLKRVSVRLNGILDGMTQVMGGDLTVRLPAENKGDELDVIARRFNEMCEELDMYIKKSYLAEIEQKNAEMAALQSQINPHFLYNTLEAIRMKAICNGDSEVGKMLYSMAVTFRSQLKEADVITLAQELHYCKKYLELFEYRYLRQFSSDVDCPLEYMQTPIIKFVLQPLIENYFVHGIRMQDDDNYIHICVKKDGEDFEIIVEDNGRGMPLGEIAAKNRELEADRMGKKDSIGLSNVNRRVKAVYGRAYGVRIEPARGRGLRVILRFRPQEKEESNHEKSNDCRG